MPLRMHILISYARALRAEGLPATSVNWSIWQDVGMAADLAAGRRSQGTGFAKFAPRMRGEVYEQCIATSDWMLNEHRTHDGSAVVPGTGLIQLACKAVQAQLANGGGLNLKLEDVMLYAPLRVEDGDQKVAAVRFAGDKDTSEFEILSAATPRAAAAEEWQGEHVNGRISRANAVSRTKIEIAPLIERLSEEGELVTAGMTSPFMQFGERWNCLRGYWSGRSGNAGGA